MSGRLLVGWAGLLLSSFSLVALLYHLSSQVMPEAAQLRAYFTSQHLPPCEGRLKLHSMRCAGKAKKGQALLILKDRRRRGSKQPFCLSRTTALPRLPRCLWYMPCEPIPL